MTLWNRAISVTVGEAPADFFGYAQVADGAQIETETPLDFTGMAVAMSVYTSASPSAQTILTLTAATSSSVGSIGFGTRTDADTGFTFATIEWSMTAATTSTFTPGQWYYRVVCTSGTKPFVAASGEFLVEF